MTVELEHFLLLARIGPPDFLGRLRINLRRQHCQATFSDAIGQPRSEGALLQICADSVVAVPEATHDTKPTVALEVGVMRVGPQKCLVQFLGIAVLPVKLVLQIVDDFLERRHCSRPLKVMASGTVGHGV